jgi:hypothetical protein
VFVLLLGHGRQQLADDDGGGVDEGLRLALDEDEGRFVAVRLSAL